MQPERGKRHRLDILASLARLPRNREHKLSQVMDHARPLLESTTTGVVFTPTPVAQGLDTGRSSLVMVSPMNEKMRGWFKFNNNVDFYTCMPADQQPKLRYEVEYEKKK